MRDDQPAEAAADARLNALLDASAPPSAAPENPLDRALREVAAEARERAGRRARRTRTAVVTTLVTAALVVSGTSAAASSGLLDWIGWSPDRQVSQDVTDGTSCEQAWRIIGDEHAPITADAREILASIDVASLDLAPLVAEVQREHDESEWVLEPGERPWEYTQAGLETEAISRYVGEAVWSGLERLGYGEDDWSGMSIEGAGGCTADLTVVP